MNVILRDGIDHVYPELHAAVCVVGPGVRDAADAVVAVAQQLDTETVVLVSELVKPDNTSRMREGKGERGLSYLANSSLRRRISSSAVHWAESWVKPQMSAKRILK